METQPEQSPSMTCFLFFFRSSTNWTFSFQTITPTTKSIRNTPQAWGFRSPLKTTPPGRPRTCPGPTSPRHSLRQDPQTVMMLMSSRRRGSRGATGPLSPVSSLRSWRKRSQGHIILMSLRGESKHTFLWFSQSPFSLSVQFFLVS